jgi:8-oxo-dGTP pyrophosphatase MutT (NUDIX family)
MGSFSDSMRENITGGLLKLKDLNSADRVPFGSQRDFVDSETLNAKYGLEGLDFSKHGPRTDAQAKYMYNRKLAEIERKDRRERATGWATAAGVGQDLVAGMLDPVGMGVGFAIAPAKFVPGLKALVPVAENTAGKFLPRAASAFATTGFNTTVGMAALEPANYYAHQQEGADYTMADSLVNIAVGGVAGGLLHSGALGAYRIGQVTNKGLHWVGDQVPEGWFGKIAPETHERAFDTRLKQILAGDDTGIEPIIRSDRNVQAESRVAASIDEQLKRTQPTSEPDVNVLAAELKAIAREMDLEEITLKSLPGRSSERFDQLKMDFDGRIEQLVKAKQVKLKTTSDGVELDGHAIKYDLEDITLNGVTFRKVRSVPEHLTDFDQAVGYFKNMSAEGNPFELFSVNDHVMVGGVEKPAAYGTVIIEKDGRIWVTKPKDGFGGYLTSFSKGRLDGAEDAYATAVRETFEETGLVVKGVDYLGGFDRSTSFTHYMVAERVDGSPQAFGHETEGMELLSVKELYKRLTSEGNANDAAVLEKAIAWINKNQKSDSNIFVPHIAKLSEEDAAALLTRTKNPYAVSTDMTVPVIHADQLGDQISGPLGSNDGGIYRLSDGTQVYAKFPSNPDQISTEIAAGLLYSKAGQFGQVGTPQLRVIVRDGKPVGVASEWIEGLKPISPDDLAARLSDPRLSPAEEEHIRQIGGSWIFDAWINNHDVYGTGPTWNIFSDGHGNYIKLDFGGSMDFRAQGGTKNFDSNVSEIGTFPEHAGKNLIAATVDSQAVGAEMVLRMSPEDIKGALTSAGFEGDKLNRLVSKLIARQDSIRKQFPDIAYHIDGIYNNVTHAGSLKLADLWLEQMASKLTHKLTNAMKATIDAYKGSWAYDINKQLWDGGPVQGKDLSSLRELDEAMALSEGLSTETVMWRWQDSYSMGLTPLNVKSTLEKTAYLYKSFMSASTHTDTSMAGRDVLWRLEVEPGVKGIPTKVLKTIHGDEPFASEYEFILPRGQLLVIDGVDKVVSWIHGSPQEHWQVRARVVNPANLSKDADSLIQTLHASMADKKVEPTDMFGGDVEAHINKLVDDLYQARKPPEVPTLTESVDVKTPAMLAFEKEIADMQAAIKDLDLDDLALKELEMADAKIKDTDSFVDGLKQAWACMKGL